VDEDSSDSEFEDIGSGKCSLVSLVLLQILATLAQAGTVTLTVLIFLDQGIDHNQPRLLVLGGLAFLGSLYGFLTL